MILFLFLFSVGKRFLGGGSGLNSDRKLRSCDQRGACRSGGLRRNVMK